MRPHHPRRPRHGLMVDHPRGRERRLRGRGLVTGEDRGGQTVVEWPLRVRFGVCPLLSVLLFLARLVFLVLLQRIAPILTHGGGGACNRCVVVVLSVQRFVCGISLKIGDVFLEWNLQGGSIFVRAFAPLVQILECSFLPCHERKVQNNCNVADISQLRPSCRD